MAVPIIDLFAGPGGLGEGFTSLTNEKGNRIFKIGISVEKDEFAHQTLVLRSFIRQFKPKEIPDKYYAFLKGKITKETLFNSFPKQYEKAVEEAQLIELGKYPLEKLDAQIVDALGNSRKWVLIGGPPCQAYSLVGRSRRGGIDPNDERVYLYREYYRILAVHNPPIFIMENVKGILSSRVNDELIFKQILADLENPVEAYLKLQGHKSNLICPGYHIYSLVKAPTSVDIFGNPVLEPSDFIIKSEEYGIPQARHRLILLGIRKDVRIKNIPQLKKTGLIPLRKVLQGLPEIRSGISKGEDNPKRWRETILDIPNQRFFFEIADPKIKDLIKKTVKSLADFKNDTGSLYLKGKITISFRPDWYIDKRMEGICNHESRTHIVPDLYRYLYASCFTEVNGRSPKLSEFPISILPLHKNVRTGVSENKFGDRFRVQSWNTPSKTITSHISKDGHYYIHPDPKQCRSLTVREAARIQTFPDNYFFCGPRTQQYHQVGNAVPPLLANQIARIVAEIINF